VSELDPQTYDEVKSKFGGKGLMDFSFFFIEKKYCEIFDTTQKIMRSTPPLMKHIERHCEIADCKAYGHHKVMHI